jgi:Domain of Unknown Function (DUF1080)
LRRSDAEVSIIAGEQVHGVNMKSAILRSSLGLILAVCVLNAPSAFAADEKTANDGWVSLFNGKDFAGWYTYLDSSGKNKDPKGVFKVENGMIHILESDNGYLATTQDFSNVRIHAEYKWDTKRASEGKRNSGLLYLAVGPDAIYPTSLECQIEETDVGDLWIVNGAAVTAFFIAPAMPVYDDDMQTGTRVRSAPGDSLRVLKSGDFENRDGWNTVEVIIRGDRSTHLVNGRIVNNARDIRRPDPNNPAHMVPLTSGRIFLEAEGSEIWFRDIRIRPLGASEKP